MKLLRGVSNTYLDLDTDRYGGCCADKICDTTSLNLHCRVLTILSLASIYKLRGAVLSPNFHIILMAYD